MTKRFYSAGLKSTIAKLDVDKLKTVLDNLCRLCNAVVNVVKNTEFNKSSFKSQCYWY